MAMSPSYRLSLVAFIVLAGAPVFAAIGRLREAPAFAYELPDIFRAVRTKVGDLFRLVWTGPTLALLSALAATLLRRARRLPGLAGWVRTGPGSWALSERVVTRFEPSALAA